jgi:uncharacterized protein (DUF697 family)
VSIRSLPSANTFTSVLNVLREVDVRPLRAAAEATFILAVFSRDVPLARHLVSLLDHGLRQHETPPARVSGAFPLSAFSADERLPHVNIAVILTRQRESITAEQQLLSKLAQAGVPSLVCLLTEHAAAPPIPADWLPASVIALTMRDGLLDDAEVTRQLVNGIRSMRIVDDLALARHLPAFRESVTRSMIDDTAMANAVYSVGSGLLEINPVANIPLNAADIVVLTKNQAIMSYKLALAMGMNADFKQVMPQLAAVVGSGFLLRQTARGLIGLVPGLGLIPKVAVAFAGTYATGEVIYRWCAHGERITGAAVRQLYDAAFARGKTLARTLASKAKETSEQARNRAIALRRKVPPLRRR